MLHTASTKRRINICVCLFYDVCVCIQCVAVFVTCVRLCVCLCVSIWLQILFGNFSLPAPGKFYCGKKQLHFQSLIVGKLGIQEVMEALDTGV